MNKYQRIKTLGEGSYGKVFLVKNKNDDSMCCLKYIKLKGLSRADRDACHTEVQLLQQLQHPHIVQLKESFISKGDALCIIMEYCNSGDLHELITKKTDKKAKPDVVMKQFVQMLLGLHYMHQNRILYRDLKTQNIFLKDDGNLFLGDFGISKRLDSTSDFAQTCIGTPYTMSPELLDNKPYNFKSDIWSLGCVLYHVVMNRYPFDGKSYHGLVYKISRGRFDPIPESACNPELAELISKMLRLRPNDRPCTEEILKSSVVQRNLRRLYFDELSNLSRTEGLETKRWQNLQQQLESIGINIKSMSENPEDDSSPVKQKMIAKAKVSLVKKATDDNAKKAAAARESNAAKFLKARKPKQEKPDTSNQPTSPKVTKTPLKAPVPAPSPTSPKSISSPVTSNVPKEQVAKFVAQRMAMANANKVKVHRAPITASNLGQTVKSTAPPAPSLDAAPMQPLMPPPAPAPFVAPTYTVQTVQHNVSNNLSSSFEKTVVSSPKEDESNNNAIVVETLPPRVPIGRLSARVSNIQQICIQALGIDEFNRVYQSVKYTSDPDIEQVMGKFSYLRCGHHIKQLLFMEHALED